MKEMTEQEARLRLSAICSQAEHCSHEMVEKMRRWGVAEEAQARIMEYLTTNRFVDDERFARAFAIDKIKYNKWGRRKVEQAMWQKHIDSDIRQRVLDDISEDEYMADMAAAQKKQADAQNYLANLQRTTEAEIAQQQVQLMDSIRNYVKIYNEDKHYDAILLKSAGLYFDESLDVTKEILEGLNARYNKK